MYKCGNTIFEGIKRFQVRENSSQQIIVVLTKVIKKIQKMPIYDPLKMILHGVSSTSNMLPTLV
jgi:hypothetical protein